MHCLNHHDGWGRLRKRKIRLTSDDPLRFNMFQVVGLDPFEPLFDTAFDVPAALTHVAKQSSGQAKIRLSVRIDLEIHEV
jgi:hypothetical protein